MEEILKFGDLFNNYSDELSAPVTMFNFILCMVMAFIVRAIYISRSYSLTGKMHIASVLPVLSAVVFLVIIVVKSSLALSLGLVGALSIVRFRTPIKEPEELVYLFLSIAIGLGYAAGHSLITTVLTLSILLIIYFLLSNRKNLNSNEYNLILNWSDQSLKIASLLDTISECSDTVKLIRLDEAGESHTMVLLISPKDKCDYDSVIGNLKSMNDNIKVSIFEAKTNW